MASSTGPAGMETAGSDVYAMDDSIAGSTADLGADKSGAAFIVTDMATLVTVGS